MYVGGSRLWLPVSLVTSDFENTIAALRDDESPLASRLLPLLGDDAESFIVILGVDFKVETKFKKLKRSDAGVRE